MKPLIVLFLLAIVGALGTAGMAMLRRRDEAGAGDDDGRRDKAMARALAWRVGLSVALFALVMLAWAMGWIQPRAVAG